LSMVEVLSTNLEVGVPPSDEPTPLVACYLADRRAEDVRLAPTRSPLATAGTRAKALPRCSRAVELGLRHRSCKSGNLPLACVVGRFTE
jgi:hypothetical protein